MTTQQLIERLQAVQDKAGHAVEVAVSLGAELPNVDDLITAGTGDEQIAVLRIENEHYLLDVLREIR